jgi:alpha-glucosidase
VLKDGSLKPLLAEYGRIAYARLDDETRCIIAVNNTGGWTDFRLFARDAGALDDEAFFRRVQTSQDGHENKPEEVCRVSDGFLAFDLPPFSSVILCNRVPDKTDKPSA